MTTLAGNPITFSTKDEPFSIDGVPTTPTLVVFVWVFVDSSNAVTSGQFVTGDVELVIDGPGVVHVTMGTSEAPEANGGVMFGLFAAQGVGEALGYTSETVTALPNPLVAPDFGP